MLVLALFLMCGAGIEGHEQAVLLHAQGQQAELNGALDEAFGNLRQAHALAQNDATIAFDLARLAMLHPAMARDGDTEDFVDLPPVNADARVLRAYLLALRREVYAAENEIDAALNLEPAHPEALAARAMLAGLRPGTDAGLLGLRLRVSGEFDSNVGLLPQDLPSNAQGMRAVVDAGLRFTPVRGAFRLDLNANVYGAFHLNDRTTLQPYDVASATAWAALGWDPGAVKFTLDAVGSIVFAGEQKDAFSKDVYALLQMRIPIDTFAVGLYGLAGYRSFGLDNASGDNDRTGGHDEVGILGEWQNGAFGTAVRGGYLVENAHGLLQNVHGATAAVVARYAAADWTVAAAFSYAYRDYLHNPLIRHDHVLEPALQATYELVEHLRLVGSYTFIDVQSLGPYTYARHIVAVGLETAW